jgi:7-carboxy-7-deazaguanine synthase
MDIKCPSSGEDTKMDLSNLDHLKHGDQVKFIIADEKDYSHAKNIYSSHLRNYDFEIIFTPCEMESFENLITLQKMAEKVLDDSLNVRVLPQLHKILWPVKNRGI